MMGIIGVSVAALILVFSVTSLPVALGLILVPTSAALHYAFNDRETFDVASEEATEAVTEEADAATFFYEDSLVASEFEYPITDYSENITWHGLWRYTRITRDDSTIASLTEHDHMVLSVNPSNPNHLETDIPQWGSFEYQIAALNKNESGTFSFSEGVFTFEYTDKRTGTAENTRFFELNYLSNDSLCLAEVPYKDSGNLKFEYRRP
jgi:hypothetical protein